MNLEQEFDRRIAAIHGLDNAAREQSNMQESSMDIRHEEFQAMASVFLGDDFPATTLRHVEDLQIALHEQQADLYRRYESGDLEPQMYIESFNTLLNDTFAACETLLGEENFLRLFGAPRSEATGLIDPDAFLEAHKSRQALLEGEGL